MQLFQDILKRELSKPVPLKNQPGVTIDPMEAMVKSVMNEAMKGSIQHIAFINAMTRDCDPASDAKERQAHQQQLSEICQRLTDQLKAEGAYDGQNAEIEMLAETQLLVERLNSIIAASDFQPVVTDTRTGHQTVNPVITLRDKQREQFEQILDKLRTDGIRRNFNKKKR